MVNPAQNGPLSVVPHWQEELLGLSDPATYWSTANIGEAMPGVLTPLGWSIWGPAGERVTRGAFYRMGAMPRSETDEPDDPRRRFLNVFYGRTAANVDFMMRIGNVMPGTSGEAVARQTLGFVPAGHVGHSSVRRWPAVAARLPVTFARMPALVRRCREETDEWWRREVNALPGADLAKARASFVSARRRFEYNLLTHSTFFLACWQPLYDQFSRLAVASGADPAGLMTGHGSHEETAVVSDLWALSRDKLTMAAFLDRHGYHGPREGEISGRVWREDPAVVHRLVEGYRAVDNDASPTTLEAERRRAREQAEASMLAALPIPSRPRARLVLRMAARRFPLRGVGKVAFLQGIDVLRAAARRVGACLAHSGRIDDPESVFFLTAAELTEEVSLPGSAVIAERRRRHEHYRTLRIPSHFRGAPEPVVDTEPVEGASRLTGIGASPGVVKGSAVVVDDPATAEVKAGDILVAHTTDPSWASLMFLVDALVVDIGGLLSHAAVVARELGIPCVMNVKEGTRVLRTGDVCRVDGSAGTVEVL